MVGAAPASASAAPADATGDVSIQQTTVARYGPWTVAPGTHTGNLTFSVPRPCQGCYITGMQADLMNHHMVQQTFVPGRVVFASGHQHDDGVRVEASRGSTSICNSVAGYGEDPAYLDHLSSMSTCAGNLATLARGDVVRLHSIYDSPASQFDVPVRRLIHLPPASGKHLHRGRFPPS